MSSHTLRERLLSASAARPCPPFWSWSRQARCGGAGALRQKYRRTAQVYLCKSVPTSTPADVCKVPEDSYVRLLACRAQATGLLDMLKAAIEDSSSALAREGALLVFSSLCQVVGKPAEPFLVPLLGNVLGCYCDKVRRPDLCCSRRLMLLELL